MNTRLKIGLLFIILVFPAVLSIATAKVSFSRAKSVEFCGSCHTMQPWIEDVTGKDGDSLAAEHFQRRWIQHDQCFTCHSNYDFLGPLEAKIRGMHHVVAFYTGGAQGHIQLYEDFPNANCLQCHGQAKGFLEESAHDPVADLVSGKDRCVECHDQFHNVEQDEESATDGDGAEPAAEADPAEPEGE